ncbi:uncharacterized protein B0P05DRAFT_574431 [Gilbertella persicaria]|uniref:uncharacterized protein n=1 Tax=Gilbertella persicaria TaxID=101096 RepID=UPI0022206A18|nr:uncharacterized protein B0P05DRAFT_574431 [Gilbertella persicaria]KAI8062840.1 hypothetical protein B0P05DRAFT_574431 [Gilbertella persicaria]
MNIHYLPFELLQRIGDYLGFSDIWYLGTCSHKSRQIAHQIIRSKYHIDLHSSLIHPFSHFVHAAVAYLGRYGLVQNRIEPSVLQSVANHLAIAIHDRLPTSSNRAFSYDFLLNETLGILFDHALLDPTLHAAPPPLELKLRKEDLGQKLDDLQTEALDTTDPYALQSAGVLMIDFLMLLQSILEILFDQECSVDTYRLLLLFHLKRILNNVREQYHLYHTHASAYPVSEPFHMEKATYPFHQFLKFFCLMVQTDVLSPKDVDDFASEHLAQFFVTKPFDVGFSLLNEFKIFVRHPHQDLAQVNTVTQEKTPALYYLWKLWLQEIQLRQHALLVALKAMIKKCMNQGVQPSCSQITSMLKYTSLALSWIETGQYNDVEKALIARQTMI